MNKLKLLKSILIPTLGISAIGSIIAVSTSCSCGRKSVIHVESVKLNKSETTLTVGECEKITASVLPETATDKSVTWSSSNLSVATVDNNGTINAKWLGNATITVKTNDGGKGGKTATCEVTVISPYIAITANEDSTLSLQNNGGNNPDLQYSTDRTNWTAYSTEISIDQGKNLYLKGNNPTGWSHSDGLYSTLSITGNVSIAGNVMGLLDNGAKPGEQGDITGIPCDYCFYSLFSNSTGITSISENFLPATTLAPQCYEHMFEGCTSLTTAPELPAATLAKFCYYDMFGGCTSLTTAPKLPATTLAYGCYYDMFEGCTSLTTAPKLPATTLAEWCYHVMFYGCTSLTTAPELPATTLAPQCYGHMFEGCTSLTTAPALPATTLADYCYWGMFAFCSSLSTAPALPATTLAYDCYSRMFYDCSSLNSIKIAYTGNYDYAYFRDWAIGVASSGTFYYRGIQTAQDFQLPSGWTIHNNWFVIITANEDSTLTLKNNGGNNPDLQYSTDGTNWSTYNEAIKITHDQSLYLKGNNPTGWAHRLNDTILYSTLSITGDVSISGNVMGLLDNGAKSGEQGDITGIPCDNCFSYLFSHSQITSVGEDFLPATTLTDGCYFGMFQGCTSLTTAPALPATSLVEGCYYAMFLDCWSLTTAPDLPAKTLINDCYRAMFAYCTSLSTAPDLPATTLADNCYTYMFKGCTFLNLIKISYTGNYDSTYFSDWVSGVASSGTFYYNGSQTAQDFQLPSDWITKHFNLKQ